MDVRIVKYLGIYLMRWVIPLPKTDFSGNGPSLRAFVDLFPWTFNAKLRSR